MSSMKRRTFSSSRTEGIGRLMTFIGTCTVGRSPVANFEKLTKGRGAVLAGESCEGAWSMASAERECARCSCRGESLQMALVG